MSLNCVFVCRIEFDARGGRSSYHLLFIEQKAANFSHIFVICADNGMRQNGAEATGVDFNLFANRLAPRNVKFAGNLHRKDFNIDFVAENNKTLQKKLGNRLKSAKIIKNKDFSDHDPAHFLNTGYGPANLAKLIYSVAVEFCES